MLGDVSVDVNTSFLSAVSVDAVAVFPENLLPKRFINELRFPGEDEPILSFQWLCFFASSPSPCRLLFRPRETDLLLVKENDHIASLPPLIELNFWLSFLDNSLSIAGLSDEAPSFLSDCLVFPPFLLLFPSPISLLLFKLPREDLYVIFDLFFLPLPSSLLPWRFLSRDLEDDRGPDEDVIFPFEVVEQRLVLSTFTCSSPLSDFEFAFPDLSSLYNNVKAVSLIRDEASFFDEDVLSFFLECGVTTATAVEVSCSCCCCCSVVGNPFHLTSFSSLGTTVTATASAFLADLLLRVD